SHDLRAPLRAIIGFTKIVLDDYGNTLDPKVIDHLLRVSKAGERMGELIDDLLNLSRVTREEMRQSRFDLTAIAESIVREMQRAEHERSIQIQITPGMMMHGDANLMRIVLRNLLENAWKFTRKKPDASVEVGVVAQSGPPVFFVRDNGAGFDMKYAS